MKFRRLGNTGLKVSEISLGSWLTVGGYVERESSVNCIHKAYEAGINFFDTANIYNRGAAEQIVGETLKKYPRESYVLATKLYFAMGDGPNNRGLSRKHIMEQCHASLKRLGTEYVDIYYCHRFDNETPMEETLRALDDLVTQGKVLYVGVSEWKASQQAEALAVADKYLLDRFVVHQPAYHMFKRDIEQEIIPLGERLGIGQVVYSPLATGLLAGKYTSASDYPKGSRAASLELDYIRREITEERIAKVNLLSGLAKELDITVSQLALAWVLRQPNIASAIIGASRPQQVEENVKASGIVLSSQVLERIEEILLS